MALASLFGGSFLFSCCSFPPSPPPVRYEGLVPQPDPQLTRPASHSEPGLQQGRLVPTIMVVPVGVVDPSPYSSYGLPPVPSGDSKDRREEAKFRGRGGGFWDPFLAFDLRRRDEYNNPDFVDATFGSPPGGSGEEKTPAADYTSDRDTFTLSGDRRTQPSPVLLPSTFSYTFPIEGQGDAGDKTENPGGPRLTVKEDQALEEPDLSSFSSEVGTNPKDVDPKPFNVLVPSTFEYTFPSETRDTEEEKEEEEEDEGEDKTSVIKSTEADDLFAAQVDKLLYSPDEEPNPFSVLIPSTFDYIFPYKSRGTGEEEEEERGEDKTETTSVIKSTEADDLFAAQIDRFHYSPDENPNPFSVLIPSTFDYTFPAESHDGGNKQQGDETVIVVRPDGAEDPHHPGQQDSDVNVTDPTRSFHEVINVYDPKNMTNVTQPLLPHNETFLELNCTEDDCVGTESDVFVITKIPEEKEEPKGQSQNPESENGHGVGDKEAEKGSGCECSCHDGASSHGDTHVATDTEEESTVTTWDPPTTTELPHPGVDEESTTEIGVDSNEEDRLGTEAPKEIVAITEGIIIDDSRSSEVTWATDEDLGLATTTRLFALEDLPPRKTPPPTGRSASKWWNSIIYQIYPRSFRDHSGSGTGDLKGITAKADYLYDLGVKTLWISPFFTSPMVDFGYDISNFVDVDPIFGSLADFDELVKTMHSKDIKVVLDFVPNHSSDEHEWFQRSLRREEPYTDYYVWADPKGFNDSGHPIPPNNWLSVFRGSAWTWREERSQFYYHQFHHKQPDLNFRNPLVQEEIKNVFKFWLDRGADGFRVDALKHLFEVEDLSLDEPVDEEAGVEDNLQYNYLKHPFTTDQPETFEVVRDWRKMLDTYPDKLMMTEVYNDDIREVMKYYGNDTDPLADFPFNFRLIEKLQKRSDVTGTRLKNIIDEWVDNLPEGKWPNWVLGNHDQSRVASRVGNDLVDALNMLTLLLPGTPVTYYGEEIGMQDADISWEDTKDPQGCNFGPDRYQEHSRDPCRTPMQWDATPNAGFSKGPSTWLPVNDNYKTLNVKAQAEARESHLKVYRTLARLRQESSFAKGKLAFPVVTEEVLAFIRYLEDEPTYLVVLNLSENDVVVDLHHHTNLELPPDASVITRSVSDKSEENSPGSEVNLGALMLVSGEGLVLQLPFAEEIE